MTSYLPPSCTSVALGLAAQYGPDVGKRYLALERQARGQSGGDTGWTELPRIKEGCTVTTIDVDGLTLPAAETPYGTWVCKADICRAVGRNTAALSRVFRLTKLSLKLSELGFSPQHRNVRWGETKRSRKCVSLANARIAIAAFRAIDQR